MAVKSAEVKTEKIVTHVIMPSGSLNKRAAEAAALNGAGRGDYHGAILPEISEKDLLEEVHAAEKARPVRT